jgi:hypothetical protein
MKWHGQDCSLAPGIRNLADDKVVEFNLHDVQPLATGN